MCEKVCEKIWVRKKFECEIGGVGGSPAWVSEANELERSDHWSQCTIFDNMKKMILSVCDSVRGGAGTRRRAERVEQAHRAPSRPQQIPANSPPTPACFESILKSIFNLKATPLHLLYNSRAPFSIFRMTEINGENSIYFISSLLKISSQ